MWATVPVGELWSPSSSTCALGCCVMRCQGSWLHGTISEMSLSLHSLLWHQLCLSRLCALVSSWCGAQGLCALSSLCAGNTRNVGASLSPQLKDTFMPPIPLLAAAQWWLRGHLYDLCGKSGTQVLSMLRPPSIRRESGLGLRRQKGSPCRLTGKG